MSDEMDVSRVRRGIPDLVDRAEWFLGATVRERMDAGVHAEDVIAELVDALHVAQSEGAAR